MKNRKQLLTIAMIAGATMALTDMAAVAQTAPESETFQLVQVGQLALPAVVEQKDGCREEVLSGTLTLKGGAWTLVTREREVCGDEVEEEGESEAGKYRLEGTLIRFSRDGDDDAKGDADDDLDVEDMTDGTRTADGLSVRLDDGKTTLSYRRTR
jgi:hypothetical protein